MMGPTPSTVDKVGLFKRYPINAQYAGGIWRNGDPSKMPADWKYGNIKFTEKGSQTSVIMSILTILP